MVRLTVPTKSECLTGSEEFVVATLQEMLQEEAYDSMWKVLRQCKNTLPEHVVKHWEEIILLAESPQSLEVGPAPLEFAE